MGKTIQAIGIINCIPDIKNILVVCPAAVKLHWARELQKWLVKKRTIDLATGKHWPRNADAVIINYENLTKHEAIHERPWDIIIGDEIHSLANSKAKRTKAFTSLKARYRVGLTGTPIVNKMMDLFPSLHWLDPNQFVSLYSFKSKFTDKDGNSNRNQRSMVQDRLRSTLMVRRLKKDVLKELPEIQYQVIEVEPPNDCVSEELRIAEKHEEDLTRLEAALELAKVSGDPEEYKRAMSELRDGVSVSIEDMARALHNTEIAKVPVTVEHLETCLSQGIEKIVVFGHHRDCLESLNRQIPGSALFYGGMSLEDKEATVRRFIEDPRCRVWFGGLKAAGTGLDGLQHSGCKLAVFHSMWWNPAVMDQAGARIHRIGASGDPINIQYIVLSGSTDANMAFKQVEKRDLIEQSLDDGVVAEETEQEPEPLTPIRDIKGTVKTTTKELDRTLPPDTIALIHIALKNVAHSCDGANSRDGHGFSKYDSIIGNRLANMSKISNSQALLGRKLVRKYRKQLPEELVEMALKL